MNIDQPATNKGTSTRERILIAARQSLLDQGYEAFVLRELADNLDMKLGNLQYYFKTRESLVLEVMRLEGAKDVAIVKTHLAQSSSPDTALDAIVSELVARWRTKSGVLYSTLGSLSLHNKLFRKLYREIYLAFYDSFEYLLHELNPDLSTEDVKYRTRMITALIDGAAMQIRTGNADAYYAEVKSHVKLIALSP